jgi:hypothetical protein
MRKLHIVTAARLKRARLAVKAELYRHGVWQKPIANIPVHLVLFSACYGWQEYGTTGEIRIPRYSLCRMRDWYFNRYTSLRDVLRHEYGHAIAYCYPRLIGSKRFRRAFGYPHDSLQILEFMPGFHVTEYSAVSPAEDFAELFMIYLGRSGKLPEHLATPPVRRKWRFIKRLCIAIKGGVRSL